VSGERLDEFAFSRSRRSVDQNVRGVGDAVAAIRDHPRGEIAQFAEMREIIPAQRSDRRLARRRARICGASSRFLESMAPTRLEI